MLLGHILMQDMPLVYQELLPQSQLSIQKHRDKEIDFILFDDIIEESSLSK